MKRLFLILLGLILFFSFYPSILLAEEKTKSVNFDFRKTTWGMSMAQVKKSETAKFDEKRGNIIFYRSKLNGMDCFIAYFFVKNQLVRAKYIMLNEHTNKNDYLDDFNTLRDALISKYQLPDSDNDYWKNELFKKDKEQWGLAVSIGHYSKYSRWDKEKTVIILCIDGDNYTINLEIEYDSIELDKLEDEERNKKDAQDL